MNDSQDAIIDVEVIDSQTPQLDVPLTFCIVEDQAVVIANSYPGHLDQVSLDIYDMFTIRRPSCWFIH